MLTLKRMGWGLLMAVALAACRPSDLITPTIEPTDMPGLESVPNVDVERLIRIYSPKDVVEKRTALLEFIFGQDSLPTELPEVNTYIPDDDTVWELNPFQAFDVTVLTVRMPQGLVSNLILVDTPGDSDTLVLYHIGHGRMSAADKKNAVKFAVAGYDVLILYMPMKGLNRPDTGNNPSATLETECCGIVQLGQHQQLSFLERPLSYFFTPVAVGLNYAESQGYKNFIMIGFSGGGWTTTVYAALDLRITSSFPVAGSAPLWMRIPGYEEGDFEVHFLGLYEIANYLELYVMGAHGEGRYQDQIFNFFDPCCYGGGRAKYYLPAVQDRLEDLGAGRFSIWIDHRTTGHILGENTYNHILNILENGN